MIYNYKMMKFTYQTPFSYSDSISSYIVSTKEQPDSDCSTFGQNVQKFYIFTFGLFVQKCPDTMLINSTAMLMILAINTIPPIRPPKIQFKAKIPMLPLIPKFFGISQKHILRIPNGHPTIIQYKNQSKPSVLLHTW